MIRLAFLILLGLCGVAQAQPVTTTVPYTLLNQPLTFTTPVINGAALSGTLSGTPTFSGAVTFGSGGSLSGTFSGNPTLSGNPTFSGTANVTGTLQLSGTAISPLPFTVGIGGTGLSSLTAHNLIIGNGASAATLLAPSSTSGVPLISQGSSSNPAYGTAGVAGGGTGQTTLGANALLVGNGTSGIISSTVSYSSNSLTLTNSAGCYYLDNGTSNGLCYPGTAPTAGGGNASLVALDEGGSNIAGSNMPATILDRTLDVGAYEGGSSGIRHLGTTDSNQQINADWIGLTSANDQVQPSSASYQWIAFGGTWASGDIASVEIAWTGSGSGNDTLTCTVTGSGSSWSCGGHSGSSAILAICAYFGANFDNATLVAASFYNHGAGACTANYPSSGFEGFPYLSSAYYTGTITFTNRSTTSGGTVSTAGNTGSPLDGPVGYFCNRIRPSGSSRTPIAGDNICGIYFNGPSTALPGETGPGPNNTGGALYALINTTVTNPGTSVGSLTINTSAQGTIPRFACELGCAFADSSGNWSDNGAGTLSFQSSGQIWMGNTEVLAFNGTGLSVPSALYLNGLTTATESAYLCFNGSSGLVAEDTTCGSSAFRFKNPLSEINEQDALHAISLLPTNAHVWTYKTSQGDRRVHVGLYAEDVERMDPRCAIYEDGRLKNYDERCVIDYLTVAIKAQQNEIADLRKRTKP